MLLNGFSAIEVCDLVGVAGGRKMAELAAEELVATILGSPRPAPKCDAFGGDPDRTALGVKGVIGVNGVIGVMGVIGVRGVIGGMFPSTKKEHDSLGSNGYEFHNLLPGLGAN